MVDEDESRVVLTDLISLSQASKKFGLSQSHLALLVRTNRIKGWKIGKTWLTTKDAVQAYLVLGNKPGRKKQY